MPTEYVYNTKLQDGTYWSGPRSQMPTGATGGESRSAGVLSSDKGADLVNTKVDSYNKLTAPPPAPPTLEKPTDATAPAQSTFINPETEQSATINTEDYKAGQSLTQKGYQFAEGNYPDWADDTDEQKAVRDAETEVAAAQDKLKNFSAAMASDPALRGLLDSISAQWNTRIDEMRRVNTGRKASIETTGVRLGSRYTGGAGGMFGGIVSEEERQGIARLSELEGQKNAALVAAKSAYESEQWDRYTDLVTMAESKYDKQVKTLEEIQKKQADYDKQIQDAVRQQEEDYNKYVLTPINDIMKSAAKNGAPREIINAIENATSVGGALSAAREFMQDIPTTGIVGEYLFYEKQAKLLGQDVLSFDEYQTRDANRRRSIVNINSSGLSSKQQTVFNQIANNHQKSPLIAAADRTITLKDTIKEVNKNPVNGATQLSLIYGYIQVLDQYQSAVREGEIGLNQSLIGIRGKLEVWASNLETNKQILDRATALSIAKDAQRLVGTIDTAAKQKEQQFKSQAVVNGVGEVWDEYRGGFTTSYDTGGQIINEAKAVETKVLEYATSNPQAASSIKQMRADGKTPAQIAAILGL